MKRMLKILHRLCDNWQLVRKLHCGIIDSIRLTFLLTSIQGR